MSVAKRLKGAISMRDRSICNRPSVAFGVP
jgi:hypothetical protein